MGNANCVAQVTFTSTYTSVKLNLWESYYAQKYNHITQMSDAHALRLDSAQSKRQTASAIGDP